jgi:hypothetical protein
MNARQYKKAVKKTRTLSPKQARETKLVQAADKRKFDAYARTPNGSARLIAFHDAVADADDTLAAIMAALGDGDVDEARTLAKLGRESLAGHIAELKGLL